ncbi:MAG: DEAD/DEAH box helicase [Bacteroidetes bacterium]|nr:DEAD/DEAH box helicase [Bacteroidota bacterium]
MTFTQLLTKYRKYSFSEHDKGTRFERLMQAYLQTEPKYQYKFKNVWMWNDFFAKNDLGGQDTGIDLVALTQEGDFWAIQCKCFAEDAVINKPSVDSFLATSSREFKNEDLKTTRFTNCLWIDTTGKKWGSNAEEAIRNQIPPVTRLNLNDLKEAKVDWEKLEKGIHGESARSKKKDVFPHIYDVRTATHDYFLTHDRGKLIMACGTGKTIASLKIAENETNKKGLILFLVPSIALLGQTLREWSNEADEPINAICICSDSEVSQSKKKNDDSDGFSIVDLALPASTNMKDIVQQFHRIKTKGNTGMTVVFSTYQSIEVISKAQKELIKTQNHFGEFDLIICDEAHRTTGVTIADEEESAFVKVHDNNFIKAKKRLYMTATPRLYNDDVKSKAAQADAILCSMDDPKLYGEEIYRIGFGEAVERGLLTDYKVLILTLSDQDVPPAVQKMIADKESEINSDDASKLIGCINALSKQILGDEGIIKSTDPNPMRRAVAFCQSIKISGKITSTFNLATSAYINSLPTEKKEQMVSVASKHVDGTMSAPERDNLLGWLKEDTENNECRVLTNVRCLSEGVDVPSLDAVMFLSARNSQVDVVQSVGRVMRKSPGKKYGYIIIPVVVPSTVEADKALDSNERYKVVWTVLNALRAHDDRFNAIVNKIELNKNRPEQILVGRPEYTFEDGAPVPFDPELATGTSKDISHQMALQFEQLQNVVYARMVNKVGDRLYWEQWAKSVAEIAQRHVERINRLIKETPKYEKEFARFLGGLKKNINPNINQDEAIEMLSQHIITAPVFEALFEGYSFVKNNPISIAMQKMLELLDEQSLDKDTKSLEKFYASVRKRVEGIDNSEGKQKIILELYEKYFKTAMPKMVEKLGIVYTPVEVVDFIIHSVNDVLKKEFDRSLTDENIHILDPFTGTGTFISRLFQSGLIEKKDLSRKYHKEIHANEIVLLAYYIAAVNIENAFHDALGEKEYKSFDGICLTDTFQLGESDGDDKLFTEMFPQNSERVAYQKKAPLRVIIGNPPYSVGQKSANDNAQNQSYPTLDNRIASTYVKLTDATNRNALYDSYIKAYRWSTDRLDKTGGIICFVSNGAWLDGNSADGFRKSIEKEFTSIYVFNLRGNQRTSGEVSRKEGGKIFGSGSRTPIAITLLVNNPNVKSELASSGAKVKASIHYHDIGEYLNREEKLKIINGFKSFDNKYLPLKTLNPNEYGDWLFVRNGAFDKFIALDTDKKFSPISQTFFITYSRGVATSVDAWVYNFSKQSLIHNVNKTIDHYNEQRNLITSGNQDEPIRNATLGNWTRDWLNQVKKNKIISENKNEYRTSLYRPFTKTNHYFDDDLNQERYLIPKLFPKNYHNIVICVSGIGGTKETSSFISDIIPDLNILDAGAQCFPLYYYEENLSIQKGLFDENIGQDYIRRDAISNYILEKAKKLCGKNVTKEDIFYYIYGFLHSTEYRELFGNDLKKMLPRIPLVEDVKDFWKFSKAGRKLADLHINYEKVPPYQNLILIGAEYNNFKVTKMRFPKKGQKDTISYNGLITLEDIPEKAYQYIVNGKSAIEWIMERYQITTHKESGIKNDPNDWAEEVGNPRYILDLLLSVINVSVQTVEIVEGLPKVKFE